MRTAGTKFVKYVLEKSMYKNITYYCGTPVCIPIPHGTCVDCTPPPEQSHKAAVNSIEQRQIFDTKYCNNLLSSFSQHTIGITDARFKNKL